MPLRHPNSDMQVITLSESQSNDRDYHLPAAKILPDAFAITADQFDNAKKYAEQIAAEVFATDSNGFVNLDHDTRVERAWEAIAAAPPAYYAELFENLDRYFMIWQEDEPSIANEKGPAPAKFEANAELIVEIFGDEFAAPFDGLPRAPSPREGIIEPDHGISAVLDDRSKIEPR